ncbi:rhodanese-like domain-containing protein [Haloglomus salinum]|jgi:rhodanese-related sulfurtransferase|uniref:rhodanese-like domain-containing protein n=1 Tax=Haloglomus salinum TaxID=2962673 RepID=UPI0020C998DD|nr:rhodanese-like domain-containing protein [Haloglomus salinum]
MDDEISAEELHDLLESGTDVRVVDIRSADAFRRGRLPNSENIPFRELTGRIEELAGADHVVTVCPHGEASVQAARLVASYEGFDGRVESMADGVTGWQERYGLETAAADGGETGEQDEGPEAPF